jgi:hypothetical protein
MSDTSYPSASPPNGSASSGGYSGGGGAPDLETIARMALSGDKGKNLGPLIIGQVFLTSLVSLM